MKKIYVMVLVLLAITSFVIIKDKYSLKQEPSNDLRDLQTKEGKATIDVVDQNGIQYGLRNPDGWQRYEPSESLQGTPLMYIFGGDDMNSAQAIMYSQVSPHTDSTKTSTQIMDEDMATLEKSGDIIADLGVYKIEDQRLGVKRSDGLYEANVKRIVSQNKSGHQLYITIAYVNASKATIILVMKTGSEELSKTLFPVFENTVQSFELYRK